MERAEQMISLCQERWVGWFVHRISRRPPDFVIGKDYCLRWWVIPRNRFFNIYLHKFLHDDEDLALHDHPWVNCSIPLINGYIEVRNPLLLTRTEKRPGSISFRLPTTPHRVVLFRDLYGDPVPAWSLFITGPVWREWGFVCPQGWVSYKQFTDPSDYGKTGKGCDE